MKCCVFLGVSMLTLLGLTACVPTASKHVDGASMQEEYTDDLEDKAVALEERDHYMQKTGAVEEYDTIIDEKPSEELTHEYVPEPELPVRTMNPVMPSLEHNPMDTAHTEKRENIKSKIPDKTADNIPRPLKQEIYSHVNEMPQFPGGEEQLKKWLQANLLYPAAASDNRLQGKVTVRFVVYADGTIGEIQIKKGMNPILDKEALRIMDKMPNWIPGKLDDTPVPVWCALPIVFKLQDYDN